MPILWGERDEPARIECTALTVLCPLRAKFFLEHRVNTPVAALRISR